MISLKKYSIFLSSLLFLLISLQNINAEGGDLLTKICTETTEPQKCLNILKSDKQVIEASSSSKDESDLALAIIKKIIDHTRITHGILLKKKKINPVVYTTCESLWGEMIPKYEKILEIITKNKGYKDETDDYDFMVISDNAGNCVQDLMNKKMLDPEIIKAGYLLGLLISSADKVLSKKSEEE